MYCARGPGVQNISKIHTTFLQRDRSGYRQTQDYNYYISKYLALVVPKELLVWSLNVWALLQVGFSNSFGHRSR